MYKKEEMERTLNETGFRQLVQHYRHHPIAIYAGAGVPFAGAKDPLENEKEHGMPLWTDLVRAALRAATNGDRRLLATFDRKCRRKKEWPPWSMADWVVKHCGGKKPFKEQIERMAANPKDFEQTHSTLKGRYLHSAGTLNAVSAFCAAFTCLFEEERKDKRVRRKYRFAPNPRVCAVLTPNYDCFLEAASVKMFNRALLKPVAAIGSGAGKFDELPVFHVHGYVPLPRKKGRTRRQTTRPEPFVRPVLTSSDYHKAWSRELRLNQTLAPQVHFLRHYAALFLGFSFQDFMILKLLKRLNKERRRRARFKQRSRNGQGAKESDRLYHYAVMLRSDIRSLTAKDPRFFTRLGVRPIPISGFDLIPALLGDLYISGLEADCRGGKIDIPLMRMHEGKTEATGTYRDLKPHEYWLDLFRCRQYSPTKRKLPWAIDLD